MRRHGDDRYFCLSSNIKGCETGFYESEILEVRKTYSGTVVYVVVTALDLRSTGRSVDSRPVRFHAATLDKSFTDARTAVTKQYHLMVMPCNWEGNSGLVKSVSSRRRVYDQRVTVLQRC